MQFAAEYTGSYYGAFAAIYPGLRFFEQAGRLSRARHLLHPAFHPSWMVVFLLISYLAAQAGHSAGNSDEDGGRVELATARNCWWLRTKYSGRSVTEVGKRTNTTYRLALGASRDGG